MLYQQGAAKEACPSGWSLASDEQWKELEMELGMSQSEADSEGYRGSPVGDKLKSDFYWDGTNESGFNAMPSGRRMRTTSKTVYGVGDYGRYWTSTELPLDSGRARFFASENDEVSRPERSLTVHGGTGHSVRCIRD